MSAFKPSDIARHGRRLLTAVHWLDAYSILMTVAAIAIESACYFGLFSTSSLRPVDPFHLSMLGDIFTIAWFVLEVVLWLLVVHVDKSSQLYSHLQKPLKSAYQFAAMSTVAAVLLASADVVWFGLLQ